VTKGIRIFKNSTSIVLSSSRSIDSIKLYRFKRDFDWKSLHIQATRRLFMFWWWFYNDGDVDDEASSNVPLPPSIIPTATPTTAVADLLLSLINQVPVTSPPPSPLLLSPFNVSYIDVTPQQTTTDPSTDSDTTISSSSALSITTIPCDDYGTATLSTTSLERITSYSLLLLHLLIPSQFIKLSYGDDHYCIGLTSKQRPATLPSSTSSNITKTSTPPPRYALNICLF